MTSSLTISTPVLESAVPDEDGDQSIDETTQPEKLILLDGSVWTPKPASATPWQNRIDTQFNNVWREWLASTGPSRRKRKALATPRHMATVPFVAAIPLAI